MMIPSRDKCPLKHLPDDFTGEHPLFDVLNMRWVSPIGVPGRLSYIQVYKCSEWLMPGESYCVCASHCNPATRAHITMENMHPSGLGHWLASPGNTEQYQNALTHNYEYYDLLGFLLLFWPKVKAVDPKTILTLSALEEYATIARIVKEVCL